MPVSSGIYGSCATEGLYWLPHYFRMVMNRSERRASRSRGKVTG